jgi:DUF3052 family protein
VQTRWVAGYSGTPLEQKLGIKPGTRLAVIGAPPHFAEGLELPPGAAIAARLGARVDMVVFFTVARHDLARRLATLGRAVAPDGMVWVAWPKKASKVSTDVTEDIVREVALPLGLVDTKVCAIDDTWSGLKLVWRLSERPAT